MVQNSVKEPAKWLEFVGVQVLYLVDADDERLPAEASKLCQCDQYLFDLLIVPKHDRFLILGLQAERASGLCVDFIAREPGNRLRRQVTPEWV